MGGRTGAEHAAPSGVRVPPWIADPALVVLSLACCAVYLVKGIDFVLDDWFFLRNAELDGTWHVSGRSGGDRPVGALVYMLLFGVIGAHPGAIALVLALGNGVCAVLLRRLLAAWLPIRLATGAAVLWVLLPLRTSLEAWLCTGSAVLATALTLYALLLLTPPQVSMRRVVGAALLLGVGTLSYEALCVLGLPAAVGLRLARDRGFVLRSLLPLVVIPGLAMAWAFTHRLEGRQAVGGIRNPLPVLDANFGRGIAPDGLPAVVTLLAALVGSALVLRLARHRGPGQRLTPPVGMVALGWIVLLWGVVPYLTYHYSPYGAGDRLNVLSAFGAVLVWGGLLASARPPGLRLAATATLVLVAVLVRVDRAELWSRAGLDGARVAGSIREAQPRPDRPVLVGPAPIEVDHIAAFVDHSNINAAVQVTYGTRAVRAYLALDEAEFAAADPSRFVLFDMRPASTLDEEDGFLED